MKSFLAVLAAAALACAVAAPALAMPTDDGPRVVAHAHHAAPVAPASDDGTSAFVYVLIGCGGAAALGCRRVPRCPLGHAPAEPAGELKRRHDAMTAIAIPLDGVKGRQQTDVGQRRLRRGGRPHPSDGRAPVRVGRPGRGRARARHRHRVGERRHRGGAARLRCRRHRLRAVAARTRRRAGARRGPRDRTARGRCRGAAVRRRELRRRPVRGRGDVRSQPGAGRRRARAGVPSRRDDRPGELDAGGLHRRAAAARQPLRITAARRPCADRMGRPDPAERAARRRRRTGCARASACTRSGTGRPGISPTSS